ncbi:MAG TPA: hypothetical protein VGQ35_02745 [Dongiaceae bacterium]|nr:hypothetical protein [Dongiaceae bacterium]
MKATLPSNRGHEHFQLEFGEPRRLAGEVGLLSTLDIRVPEWVDDGPLPCQLRIAGLWIRVKALIELHAAIVTWLALPLEELATSAFHGGFELAGRPGQSLSLRFWEVKHGMPGHQPVSVAVAAAFETDVSFTTDPSCLDQFAAELDVATDEYR